MSKRLGGIKRLQIQMLLFTNVVVVFTLIKNRSDLYPVPFSFLLFKAKKRISVVTS